MAGFTVRELFELLNRCDPPLRFEHTRNGWRLENMERTSQLAFGRSHEGIEITLKRLAAPTAKDVLAELDYLGDASTDSHCTRAVATARRFVEAHKEQPDG